LQARKLRPHASASGQGFRGLARVARSARSTKDPTELARIRHLSPPPSGVDAEAINREEGAVEPHRKSETHVVIPALMNRSSWRHA